jgi:hypothetical protein
VERIGEGTAMMLRVQASSSLRFRAQARIERGDWRRRWLGSTVSGASTGIKGHGGSGWFWAFELQVWFGLNLIWFCD